MAKQAIILFIRALIMGLLLYAGIRQISERGDTHPESVNLQSESVELPESFNH